MFETLIGAGLSAAGSLFSGLGARSSAKSQQRHQEAYDAAARMRTEEWTAAYRRNVPQWLVQDAEAAGFNPVTWLNGGALGWYGTQLSGLIGVEGRATQAINVPSTMQAVGGAISSFSSAFMQGSQFDRKEALEYASQETQRDIAAMKYGMSGGHINGPAGSAADSIHLLSGTGGPVYSAGARAGIQIGGGVASSSSGLSYEPFINRGKADKDASPSDIFLAFPSLKSNPKWPAANAVEDQLGDVAGSFYGPWKFGMDMYYSKTGRTGDMTEFWNEGSKRIDTTVKEFESIKGAFEKSMNGPWTSMDNYSWGNAFNRIAPFFSPVPGGSSGPRPIPQF